MREIEIITKKHKEHIDITNLVEKQIGKDWSFVYVFVPHTTCALALQEHYDGSVEEDFIDFVEKLFLLKKEYKHDLIDNNSRSHLSSMFLSSYLILPVRDGKLDLGVWQRVIFFEFDGPRKRHIRVYKL